MAIAASMSVASKLGRVIPRDLKLVAYDGTSITKLGLQPITAVRQPIEKLASIAAKKVVNMVEGKKDNLVLIASPSLIQGTTC